MRNALLAALALVVTCFAVAIGDESASLTVTNLTAYMVSVAVGTSSFPAVAPGAHVTYRSSTPVTVTARVSYRAGQGIAGSAQRSFHLAPPGPATGSGATVYFSCMVHSTITAPASGGSVTWGVTPDTLAAAVP